MKKIILFTCLISLSGFAQQVIIPSTSNIVINSGTFLNVFGLELNPTTNLTIKDNAINLSKNLVNVSYEKSSISRVYNMLNPLNGYNGTLSLYYEDTELKGGNESELNIEIKDGSTWRKYAPSTIDKTLNKITFNRPLTNVTIDKVTLAVENFELEKIIIYPNPTNSEIKILSNIAMQVYMYNSLGQKIIETTAKSIDMTPFSSGLYILRLIDIKTNKFKTYKIIKQ